LAPYILKFTQPDFPKFNRAHCFHLMPPKRKNHDTVAADSPTKKTRTVKKASSASNEGKPNSDPPSPWHGYKTAIMVLR
jgi:hypothetical protein